MHNKRILSIGVALGILFAHPSDCSSQPTDAPEKPHLSSAELSKDEVLQNRIDSLVKQRVGELSLPGYALAIIRDGKVIFKKGYGTTELESGAPVTSQTVFGLASITKTFTALTLLALVDQGKIGLDDRLDKYLDGLAPAWQSLTIRQLASMTTGILQSMPGEMRWQEQFKIVQQQPLQFEPGSNYLYSNFSYRTLGTVMEKVTSKRYIDLVRELVLDPLEMTATGTQEGVPANLLAWPYTQPEKGQGALRKLPPYRDPAIPFAAGMLFSNIDDLIKYAQGLMDKKILSSAGYQTLWVDRPPLSTGKPNPWAFGWGVSVASDLGNRKIIHMNGGVPGVCSNMLIFPDEKVAIISLANLKKRAVNKIARRAAQIYFGTDGGVEEMQVEEASQVMTPAQLSVE